MSFNASRAESLPAPRHYPERCSFRIGDLGENGVPVNQCSEIATRMVIVGESQHWFTGQTQYEIFWLCDKHDHERIN